MSKLKHLARKYNLFGFNEFENQSLTVEFEERLQEIKERNSEIILNVYYIPLTISKTLEEKGYLPTIENALPQAKAMFYTDVANGVLDDFYKFRG